MKLKKKHKQIKKIKIKISLKNLNDMITNIFQDKKCN